MAARLNSKVRRIKEVGVGMLKPLIRGPLVRIRSFFVAPVSTRLDSMQSAQLAQQRFAAEANDRAKELERRVQKLQEAVGFLHAKADESALKSRPVVHVRDAYAVPLADGYLLIPEEEEALLLMYAGAGSAGLEPGTRRVLQAAVEPGNVVIDVGASVGLHMVALARAVGPSGRVEAFEAEPRLAPFLERTMRLNGLTQVRLHKLAVGAKNGTATFHVANTIGHSSLYALTGPDSVREKVKVPLKQLDAVIPAGTQVDLIKIDVEGAELDVLRGAKRLLQESGNCAIVAECGPTHLARTDHGIDDWFGEFASLGFEAYAISEPDGQLRRASPRWVATQESVNMLFLRPGSRAHAKLLGESRQARVDG